MGLAGPFNRVKIGFDPNNNSWSKDTTRFGHRHLRELGWKPGSGLGHSASGIVHHVKVQSREEGVGLGRNSKPDQPTGLDYFEQILGRLNGREAEVVQKIEEKKQRLTGLYSNFVYAGTLEHSIKGTNEKSASAEESNRKRRESESRAEAARQEPNAKLLKNARESNSKRSKHMSSEKTGESKHSSKKCKSDVSKVKIKSGGIQKKSSKSRSDKSHKKPKSDKRSRTSKDSSDSVLPSTEKTKITGDAATAVPTRRHVGIRATRNKYIAMKRQATTDANSLREIFMQNSRRT